MLDLLFLIGFLFDCVCWVAGLVGLLFRGRGEG